MYSNVTAPGINLGLNPAASARRSALLSAALALAALTLLLALLPVQPAAAEETVWVLTQTLINPEKAPLGYHGGGNNPEFFGEERFKGMQLIYGVSEGSFTVKDRWQDREYIAWDVSITCGFDTPEETLVPGSPYELTASFSHSGRMNEPHPGCAFVYTSHILNFWPNEPLGYTLSDPGAGDSFKTWTFTVPSAEPGATLDIRAGLVSKPACAVVWEYEARAVAPGTDTTPQPDTNTQPLTASSPAPPEAPATARPSSTESASAITPGEAGTRTFTEEEFGKMLADAAAFADTYGGIGGDYEKELLRKGYIGYIWSSEGDLSIYDHTGREVDAFDPRFWDDSNGTLKPIRIGDTVRTGAGKGIVHIFAEYRSEEHMLEIGSETEVVFTRFGTTDQEVSMSVIEMLKGMIRFVGRTFTAGWRSDSIFSVRAGTTICGIRGSDVVISYDSGKDIVGAWVHEGFMEVTSDQTGEKISLSKGQGLVVEDGELGAVLPLTEDLWNDITIASDLLLPSLGEEAEAASEEPQKVRSGDFEYALLPDGTAEITWYFGNETNLTVPGTLDGHPVSSIGEDSFYSFDGLTHLTLPDSVKRIGERAFWYCFGLKSVTFGMGLETLAGNPFARCPALTDFLFPPDHSTLAERDGVLFLKPERKLVCYSSALPMKEYSVPLGILSIGDQAFTGCGILKEVILPDSIERIGDYAFDGCDGLTGFNIPDSVKHIGNRAFNGCGKLAEVRIGLGVEDVAGNPFTGCYSLEEIILSPDHPSLAVSGGVLFLKKEKRLVSYPENLYAGAYAIPRGIRSIGNGAFCGNYDLSSVLIPDSVESIGNEAFSGCDSLVRMTLPGSVKHIGNRVFADCGSLLDVTVSGGIESVGDMLFAYCESLTDVTLPDSLTGLGSGMFYRCESLTELTLPKGLTDIGDYTFSGCESLASLTLPEG